MWGDCDFLFLEGFLLLLFSFMAFSGLSFSGLIVSIFACSAGGGRILVSMVLNSSC